MKYSNNFEELSLPEYFIFGIELEAFNVKTTGENSLYTGESRNFITSKNWHMATKAEESLVGQGGAELVSPKLKDCFLDWQSISEICDLMKKYPGNKGAEVVTDEKCGFHVHFDANCLTQDPKRVELFKKLYAEAEEVLYKMCNGQNDPIRKYAINRNFKGFGPHLVSSLWRQGMAAPSGKKILKQIENGTLKVSYKKFGKLRTFASKHKLDERRYHGLNLTNIGNSEKNTIEFRMANGTLDFETIKQTIFLYASLINTAIQMAENPELYEKRANDFFRTDLSEQEKATNFLNLIMENPEDRKIYMDRWSSVKDAEIFAHNDKKGFAPNRFKREEFKNISDRTPSYFIKHAYHFIQNTLLQTNEKGDVTYDR